MESRESYWQKHITRFQDGPAQPLAHYCREHHLAYQTMLYWLRKNQAKIESQSSGRLLPVKIAKSESLPLKVTLGEIGIEVKEDFNPQLLKEIVSALRGL